MLAQGFRPIFSSLDSTRHGERAELSLLPRHGDEAAPDNNETNNEAEVVGEVTPEAPAAVETERVRLPSPGGM